MIEPQIRNPYNPNQGLATKAQVQAQEEEAKSDLVRQVRGIIATFVSNANWVYDLHKRVIEEIDVILRKPEGSVEDLNPRHWAMIKEMQKIYTPTNVGVVMRLLEPDANFGPAFQLNVTMGAEQLDSDSARRIVVRDLLKKFDASQKYREQEQEMIEGEVIQNGS